MKYDDHQRWVVSTLHVLTRSWTERWGLSLRQARITLSQAWDPLVALNHYISTHCKAIGHLPWAWGRICSNMCLIRIWRNAILGVSPWIIHLAANATRASSGSMSPKPPTLFAIQQSVYRTLVLQLQGEHDHRKLQTWAWIFWMTYRKPPQMVMKLGGITVH